MLDKEICTLPLHIHVFCFQLEGGVKSLRTGGGYMPWCKKPKNIKILRFGPNYQVTLNMRHFIPNLRNILTVGSDLNVDAMCV